MNNTLNIICVASVAKNKLLVIRREASRDFDKFSLTKKMVIKKSYHCWKLLAFSFELRVVCFENYEP
jgi:hypothetical protein